MMTWMKLSTEPAIQMENCCEHWGWGRKGARTFYVLVLRCQEKRGWGEETEMLGHGEITNVTLPLLSLLPCAPLFFLSSGVTVGPRPLPV